MCVTLICYSGVPVIKYWYGFTQHYYLEYFISSHRVGLHYIWVWSLFDTSYLLVSFSFTAVPYIYLIYWVCVFDWSVFIWHVLFQCYFKEQRNLLFPDYKIFTEWVVLFLYFLYKTSLIKSFKMFTFWCSRNNMPFQHNLLLRGISVIIVYCWSTDKDVHNRETDCVFHSPLATLWWLCRFVLQPI